MPFSDIEALDHFRDKREYIMVWVMKGERRRSAKQIHYLRMLIGRCRVDSPGSQLRFPIRLQRFWRRDNLGLQIINF